MMMVLTTGLVSSIEIYLVTDIAVSLETKDQLGDTIDEKPPEPPASLCQLLTTMMLTKQVDTRRRRRRLDEDTAVGRPPHLHYGIVNAGSEW